MKGPPSQWRQGLSPSKTQMVISTVPQKQKSGLTWTSLSGLQLLCRGVRGWGRPEMQLEQWVEQNGCHLSLC